MTWTHHARRPEKRSSPIIFSMTMETPPDGLSMALGSNFFLWWAPSEWHGRARWALDLGSIKVSDNRGCNSSQRRYYQSKTGLSCWSQSPNGGGNKSGSFGFSWGGLLSKVGVEVGAKVLDIELGDSMGRMVAWKVVGDRLIRTRH